MDARIPYSDNLQLIMMQHSLEARDVAFAILVAEGLSSAEAYIMLHPEQPWVAAEINAQKLLVGNANLCRYIDALRSRKSRHRDASNLDTKDGVMAEYKHLYGSLDEADAKLKVEVLHKITDLNQMKKESEKQQRHEIMFYLPLRCNECPYKPDSEGKNND